MLRRCRRRLSDDGGDGERIALRRSTPEIVEVLRSLGISDEIVERALERGDPIAAVFEQVLSPQMAERTVTAAEIECARRRQRRAVRRPVRRLRAPGHRAGRACLHATRRPRRWSGWAILSDIYPPEIAIQVARVYGRVLARIAQAEIQLFRTYVEPKLRAEPGDSYAAVSAIQAAFSELLPLTDPLLTGVHRRWVEHQVMQAAVGDAETGSSAPLPGAVEVTFLFCDLKDFTKYVDLEGDEAGVAAIDRFTDVVVQQRGQRFRFAKLLGDGVMLVYGDPADAVRAGAGIIDAMPSDDMPPVHASVHRGVAIAREGDYFGHAVNLAARVLGIAGPGELLATRQVIDRLRDDFGWERAGAVRVRGIAGLVELFRLQG